MQPAMDDVMHVGNRQSVLHEVMLRSHQLLMISKSLPLPLQLEVQQDMSHELIGQLMCCLLVTLQKVLPCPSNRVQQVLSQMSNEDQHLL